MRGDKYFTAIEKIPELRDYGRYVAPEARKEGTKGKSVDWEKCDVFSLGICFAELCVGKILKGINLEEFDRNVV